MKVILVTREKELFKGETDRITLPGTEGEMQIMRDHAPLLARLAAGKVLLDTDSGTKEFDISSGFAEVHKNDVTLLVRPQTEKA